MLLALVISAGISFLTGRILFAALIPTIAAGLFSSISALNNFVWFLGLFFMAAIPYGVTSLVGASIGRTVRENLPQKPIAHICGGVVALLLVLGIVGILFQRSNATAKWDAIAESSAKEYLIHQPQVLSRTGSVRSTSIHMKTSVTGSALPYASFTYYVQGTMGNARVAVGVSGTTSAPQFNLLSVEESH
jgi:hypothetical protein